MVEVVPPEQLRLLFLRPRPNQAIEFDPQGSDAIPRLFDEFDRLANASAGREVKGELPGGCEAVFRYSLLRADADVASEAAAFRPAFAHLALLVQIPGVDLAAQVEAEKGAPLTDRERELLEERVAAARAWLAVYAPERAIVQVQPKLPEEATTLGDDQRAFLGALAVAADRDGPIGGEAWQSLIFATAAAAAIPAGRAFGAIYVAFLGRTNGPRAGWLLASLDRALVDRRLREAAGWSTPGTAVDPAADAADAADAAAGSVA
jgi:lysyl-tRNA synthetase class 1